MKYFKNRSTTSCRGEKVGLTPTCLKGCKLLLGLWRGRGIGEVVAQGNHVFGLPFPAASLIEEVERNKNKNIQTRHKVGAASLQLMSKLRVAFAAYLRK